MRQIFLGIYLLLAFCNFANAQTDQSNVAYYVSAYQLGNADLYANKTRGVKSRPSDINSFYPSFAIRANQTGTVELLLKVDELGDVTDVSIVKSSSTPILDRSAVALAKKFRFEPPHKNFSTDSSIKFFVNFGRVDSSNTAKVVPFDELSEDKSPHKAKVVERLIINEAGFVESVTILESSGSAELDERAIQIGSRHIFKPFIVDGTPRKISTNLAIKFY